MRRDDLGNLAAGTRLLWCGRQEVTVVESQCRYGEWEYLLRFADGTRAWYIAGSLERL